MKQTSSKNHSVDQSNPVYHDTYRLLKSYRDAVWNLELEVQHVKREFEIEYESSIDDFLESIYLAGADLNGSKLENYAKSIEPVSYTHLWQAEFPAPPEPPSAD